MPGANRALPELLFTIDAPLNDEEWETARRQIGLNYGGSDNARLPIVVGQGASAEIINWKATDLDYINGRKFSREEVCTAYRVPPPMVGLFENATLANLDASEKQFWNNTIVPRMDKLESVINRVLVPYFGTRETLKVCYDKSGVEALREDMGKKAEILNRLFISGVPLNQALELAEIETEPVDGGDEGFIPATMVPLADASKLANEPQVTPQPAPTPRAA